MADNCSIELRRTTPLRSAVTAAIMDMHEDIGRVEQSFFHWGSRGLKKLNRETFRSTKRKVTLTVNKSTRSATLPADFDYETFVGLIIRGRKIPLRLNNQLADTKNIEDIECEDKCPKCNQDKGICEDLTVTETTTIVEVNGQAAEQTVIKRLYPDGKYYLETKIPIWDYDADTIAYHTVKEFVTELDLKPCGCIDETEENIEKIKTCCYDVWACYFAPCDECCNDYGGYMIYEDTGIIYFDKPSKFDKVYIEYQGFLPKINGQYHIPAISLETVTEWIKYKYIQNKKNVSRGEKADQLEAYKRERADMEHVMGRINISQIFEAIISTPKFDHDFDYICGSMAEGETLTVVNSAIANSGSGSGNGSGNGGNNNIVCCANAQGLAPFQIAVIAGMGTGTPIVDVNYYQLDALKGGLNLNIISVNNTNENTKNQQFTFDNVTGTIYRWQGDGVTPNNWALGDTLIASFSKLL